MRWRAALLAIAVLGAPRGASADGPVRMLLVELRDGSSYQGELVERVVGDHVTIKLATGEIKRFVWSELASSETTSATPASSPPPDAPREPPSIDVAPAEPLPPAATEVLAAAASQDLLPETSWPRPDRTPLPFEGQRLVLSVGSGLRMLDGYVLGSVGYEPLPWLGVEAGGGYGGAFGPTLRQALRLGLPIGHLRVGVGLGATEAFLRRGTDGPAVMYAGAPGVADFFNLDGALDMRILKGLSLRATVGPSWLMNAASYKALCPASPDDCSQYQGSSTPNPWSVGAQESTGSKSMLFLNAHIEVGWALPL